MNKRTHVAALLAALLVATSLAVVTVPAHAANPFIMGVDEGMLAEQEASNCLVYQNGSSRDAISLLADAGANLGRVRLWVDPHDSGGHAYGGGTSDLSAAIALATRYKNAGMQVMLDIHYSDWWADPAHQKKPKAWSGLNFTALTTQVHDYTQGVIASMKTAGVLPNFVQVGNEIRPGFLFPDGSTSDYTKLGTLLKAGISGVHDALAVGDNVETVIHLDDGGMNSEYRSFFDGITAQGVNFDVIGLSYYPFWHGTIAQLQANVNDISARYGKDVMIVEAASAWTPTDYDQGNVVGAPEIATAGYPGTIEGQTQYLRDIVQVMKNVPNARGRGVVWWEPTWRGCATAPTWGNSYGIAYGGNAGTPTNNWDNLTLFDWSGRPLSTLEVFAENTESNAVTNPGFETDTTSTNRPTGWSTWTDTAANANAIYTDGSALTGNFKLTNWKSTAYKASTWQSVSVPNGKYRVSAWVKSSGGQNLAYLWAKYYGDTEKQQTLPAGTTNQWQLATITVTVTTGQIEIGFYSDANAGNWINVDSVRVTPVR